MISHPQPALFNAARVGSTNGDRSPARVSRGKTRATRQSSSAAATWNASSNKTECRNRRWEQRAKSNDPAEKGRRGSDPTTWRPWERATSQSRQELLQCQPAIPQQIVRIAVKSPNPAGGSPPHSGGDGSRRRLNQARGRRCRMFLKETSGNIPPSTDPKEQPGQGRCSCAALFPSSSPALQTSIGTRTKLAGQLQATTLGA